MSQRVANRVHQMRTGGNQPQGRYPGLAAADFGLPASRSYPIDTLGRARDALARMQANATPAERRQIAQRIARRWPTLANSPAVLAALGKG